MPALKNWISVMVAGRLTFFSNSTLSGSGKMPFTEITYPRYCTDSHTNLHLKRPSFKLASFKRLNICSKFVKYSSFDLENTIMSSRYTKQFFPITELKTKFIRRWKVPCALVKPNARRFHSYKLFSTIKAVFSLELSSISICQYPDAKSTVEKYRWPWSMSKTSSILGNGNESFFVILFNFR